MDGFNEKKWFVYLGDHHEGPFSLADIQTKMKDGTVTPNNYVWCEGMPDWKIMSQIQAFESLLAPPPETLPTPPTPTLSPLVVEEQKSEKTADLDPLLRQKAEEEARAASAENDAGEVEESTRPSRKNRLIKFAVLLLMIAAGVFAYKRGYLNPVLKSAALRASGQAVTDFTRPYVMMAAEKFPALSRWFSPIPALDDVSPEEYAELKTAAGTRVEKAGPAVSMAVSKADLLTPSFYVSSNLPDGALFDVYVEGVPETLLNHVDFSGRVQAFIEKRLGKTNLVRFADGRPLPRGEYRVYVAESENQPPAVKAFLAALPAPSTETLPPGFARGQKLVISRTYFLGGAKDQTYTMRLKEYHDKLKLKASAELGELKQFSMTLESQLTATVNNFARLRKGRTAKAQQKAWNEFHNKWMQMDGQLNQSFAKWSAESLKSDYFYGNLYQLTQQTGQTVTQVQSLHHAYFTTNIDPKTYDVQLGQTVSQAHDLLAALKGKIDQADKMAATATGMPKRDGL